MYVYMICCGTGNKVLQLLHVPALTRTVFPEWPLCALKRRYTEPFHHIQTVPSSVGSINDTMIGAYLVLNTLTPRTGWGLHTDCMGLPQGLMMSVQAITRAPAVHLLTGAVHPAPSN
jgi:hypothetical protein